ncbi:hypothetical protein D6851_06965 [Altericroceibacterium spongiae]|uniref:Uncharacterized protein n=1 Tax=Altericroceibacterium spongiae TaxID=2320269 RepID=A0A420EM88_9SPHN|nr:hypothetical protein D6851_06965 [Altericroceibacterium spongiae]
MPFPNRSHPVFHSDRIAVRSDMKVGHAAYYRRLLVPYYFSFTESGTVSIASPAPGLSGFQEEGCGKEPGRTG